VDAFAKANEVLFNAVQGISELITRPGLINVDFADVRTVMSEMGKAMMGSATVSQQAISSPLLEDVNLHGAKGLLVNITAGPDMAIGEFEAVGNAIHEYAAPDANVVIGTAFDPEMQGDLRVTMVATGLNDSKAQVVTEKPVKAVAPPPAAEPEPENALPPGAMSPGKRFGRTGAVTNGNAAVQLDLDHLDIPAFLRRQAD